MIGRNYILMSFQDALTERLFGSLALERGGGKKYFSKNRSLQAIRTTCMNYTVSLTLLPGYTNIRAVFGA
jgi:hypothetical protein